MIVLCNDNLYGLSVYGNHIRNTEPFRVDRHIL